MNTSLNNPSVIEKNNFTIYKSNSKIVLKDKDGNLEGFTKNQNKIEEVSLKNKINMILLSVLSFTYFNTDLTIINGVSMEPTYKNYQVLLKTRYSKKLINDILDKNVVVKFKNPSGETCIKRIVACPGDKLEFDGGVVKVNGKVIDVNNKVHNQKRLNTLMKARKGSYVPPEEMILKPNQYFVMGDNRDFSSDSRDFGPIDADCILNVIDKN